MPWPKTILFLGFWISSIPIHLFANGIIFQIDKRESYFQFTAAAESFINGSSWHPPGASLQPGVHFNMSGQFTLNENDYLNPDVLANISEFAATGKTWKILTAEDCLEQISCNGMSSYQKFIFITNNTGVWNNRNYPGEDEWLDPWLSAWPMGENNSLWFSGECEMVANLKDTPPGCTNSCTDDIQSITNRREYCDNHEGSPRCGFGDMYMQLRYCMAWQMPPQCRVGCANLMLLATALCTLVKLACCLIAINSPKLRLSDSLVLLGDAISAFITDPDPTLSTKALQSLPIPKRSKLRARGSLRFQRGWKISSEPQQWCNQVNWRGDVTTFLDFASMWAFVAVGLLSMTFFGILSRGSSGYEPTYFFHTCFSFLYIH